MQIKECVMIRIEAMTEKDYAKLCGMMRKAFPDNLVEIFTLKKEWEF
jgi:hypothetical protein